MQKVKKKMLWLIIHMQRIKLFIYLKHATDSNTQSTFIVELPHID